jgi:hypothetical protein
MLMADQIDHACDRPVRAGEMLIDTHTHTKHTHTKHIHTHTHTKHRYTTAVGAMRHE